MPSAPAQIAKTVGRPRGARSARGDGLAELRALARPYVNQALKALVSIVEDESAAPSVRVSAANALLDRAFGRPSSAQEGQAREAGAPPFIVEVRQYGAAAKDQPAS